MLPGPTQGAPHPRFWFHAGWHPEWGNYGTDSGEECGVPTYYRFQTPKNGNAVFWYRYGVPSHRHVTCATSSASRLTSVTRACPVRWAASFNYGNVHIIQMSTEHGSWGAHPARQPAVLLLLTRPASTFQPCVVRPDFEPGSVQYQWLEADLASVDRSVTPFVVLTGHRYDRRPSRTTAAALRTNVTRALAMHPCTHARSPMYNSERYPDDYAVCEGMQRAFEDLLLEYKVDVALYGHYHSYQRTCKVYKNACVPDGLVRTPAPATGKRVAAVVPYNDSPGLLVYLDPLRCCYCLLQTHITVGSAGAWLDLVGFYDVRARGTQAPRCDTAVMLTLRARAAPCVTSRRSCGTSTWSRCLALCA